MNKLLLFSVFLLTSYSNHVDSIPIDSNPVDINIEISSNRTCHLCEELVGLISKDATKLNKTIGDIIIVIRDICSDISGPTGKECVFILDNIQEIMSWVTKGLSPTVICDRLKLCNTTIISKC